MIKKDGNAEDKNNKVSFQRKNNQIKQETKNQQAKNISVMISTNGEHKIAMKQDPIPPKIEIPKNVNNNSLNKPSNDQVAPMDISPPMNKKNVNEDKKKIDPSISFILRKPNNVPQSQIKNVSFSVNQSKDISSNVPPPQQSPYQSNYFKLDSKFMVELDDFLSYFGDRGDFIPKGNKTLSEVQSTFFNRFK